jgi:hypothetical protein
VALTKPMVDAQNRVALQFWIGGAAARSLALATMLGIVDRW